MMFTQFLHHILCLLNSNYNPIQDLHTFNLYTLMELYQHTIFFLFYRVLYLNNPHPDHAYKTTSNQVIFQLFSYSVVQLFKFQYSNHFTTTWVTTIVGVARSKHTDGRGK